MYVILENRILLVLCGTEKIKLYQNIHQNVSEVFLKNANCRVSLPQHFTGRFCNTTTLGIDSSKVLHNNISHLWQELPCWDLFLTSVPHHVTWHISTDSRMLSSKCLSLLSRVGPSAAQTRAVSSRFISTSSPRREVFTVQDEEEFKNKVMGNKDPVIVDFQATWCGPCKLLAPRWVRLSCYFAIWLFFFRLSKSFKSLIAFDDLVLWTLPDKRD